MSFIKSFKCKNNQINVPSSWLYIILYMQNWNSVIHYAGRGRKRKTDVDAEAAAVEEKKEKLDGVDKKDEETGQRVVIEHWWGHIENVFTHCLCNNFCELFTDIYFITTSKIPLKLNTYVTLVFEACSEFFTAKADGSTGGMLKVCVRHLRLHTLNFMWCSILRNLGGTALRSRWWRETKVTNQYSDACMIE